VTIQQLQPPQAESPIEDSGLTGWILKPPPKGLLAKSILTPQVD
jgi:hypothetical protein